MNRIPFFRLFRENLLNIRQSSVSIRLRLLFFLAMLIGILFLTVVLILLLTGTFTAGKLEAEKHFTREANSLSSSIEKDFGQISASAVSLSQAISSSAQDFFSERGIKASDLDKHPELIEPLLDSQFERLAFSLEKTRASGAFIILNMTINKSLPNAEKSRAGLYIKNMEPNIVSSSSPNMTVFRGLPNISRSRGFPLHAVWTMEFDLDNMPEFNDLMLKPVKNASELSRLYKWGDARPLPGINEQYMPCIVPLIDSEGNPFGICGFEVSSMLFKLNYVPDYSIYQRISCMLLPVQTDYFDLKASLAGGSQNHFAGNSNEKSYLKPERMYSTLTVYNYLYGYEKNSLIKGDEYIGTDREIRLVPKDSRYAEKTFSMVLIMPVAELSNHLGRNNIYIAILCFSFIIIGILAAVIISRRFVRPIITGLEVLGSVNSAEELSCMGKTNIAEINDLIEQIRRQKKSQNDLPENLFEDFLNRISSLTKTEKQIFALYLEGKSISEVNGLMFISMSTLKTHNSHIYAKLNISSRDELMLYLKLIEKCGKTGEVRSNL